MREIIEEGIDYFAHRFAELEGEEWLKQGKPDFMNITDLHKQAMEEAIDQTIKEISEEIEKVELPKYKKSWTSDGEKFTDCLAPVTPEDTRQTILALLK